MQLAPIIISIISAMLAFFSLWYSSVFAKVSIRRSYEETIAKRAQECNELWRNRVPLVDMGGRQIVADSTILEITNTIKLIENSLAINGFPAFTDFLFKQFWFLLNSDLQFFITDGTNEDKVPSLRPQFQNIHRKFKPIWQS